MPDLPYRTDRAVPQGRIARVRANSGFTLLETMLVIVIASLVMTTVLQGQHLIHNARVRSLLSQQVAAESAFLAFQDRFKAPPGDYAEASANIDCAGAPCLNGNGNGRTEAGSGGALHEEILAWQHLTAAGFIQGEFRMLDATVSAPSPDNTPRNVFGSYLEVVFDSAWGYSGNTAARHNIKTGNNVPAELLAEVDRKIDDGRPGGGTFQFSSYAADGVPPPLGGTPGACTDADSASASWLAEGGATNCGAASVLR